jgi:hypothetical protein
LPLSVALMMAGCSSSFQWVKEGLSSAVADAKYASCQLTAERILYSSAEAEEDRAERIRHESHLCMQADGWRWTESDGTELSSTPASPRQSEPSLAQVSDKPDDKPDEPASSKTEATTSTSTDDDDDGGGEDEE